MKLHYMDGLGSVDLLGPRDDDARAWLEANCDIEPWQWFAGALAVDSRYAGDIVEGFVEAGGTLV